MVFGDIWISILTAPTGSCSLISPLWYMYQLAIVLLMYTCWRPRFRNFSPCSCCCSECNSPSPLSSMRSSAAEWPALSKSNRANAKGDESVDTGSLLVGKHLRNIWLLRLLTPSSSRPGRNKTIYKTGNSNLIQCLTVCALKVIKVEINQYDLPCALYVYQLLS